MLVLKLLVKQTMFLLPSLILWGFCSAENLRNVRNVHSQNHHFQYSLKLSQFGSDDDGGGGHKDGGMKKSMNNETKGMMDMDQIMNDMGVWDFQDDSGGGGGNFTTTGTFTTDRRMLSYVKIIPDEHHVSAFLNKGVVKRFLFLNDKINNSLSITITPCTSILLWHVKFWPFENGITSSPTHIKTYRTQRTITFQEESARHGVYSVDIRAINWDSYVHLYASSFYSTPYKDPDQIYPKSSLFSFSANEKFYQHVFTHVDETEWKKDPHDLHEHQVNTNLNQNHFSSLTNKPRIWVQRLRGNRLHVKWDTSPLNPHLMGYCIVVNTKRDYSSLCSASGERWGVMPPDLLHVSLYGQQNDLLMVDGTQQNDGPFKKHRHKHRHRHGHGDTSKKRSRRTDGGNGDIVMGCLGKKTDYILNNLGAGRLYYFNVFVRDSSTNVSYPYVRTTLKYHSPKNIPNAIRDAKPTKIKLEEDKAKTTVKFSLNKPCGELLAYVMPCGGGSIVYETFLGNQTVYRSRTVDMLDIMKIQGPKRGKYFIKIERNQKNDKNRARMVEIYVGKKNKRFPLPKLPAITKLTEDESGRSCDSVTIQWWPSPDPRDNEYCIFLKESKKSIPIFKKPNQCDVERSLKSDPYVTHSLCLQRSLTPETMLLHQKIVGLQPDKTYVVQLIVRRYNGKSLSYDLVFVKTLPKCGE